MRVSNSWHCIPAVLLAFGIVALPGCGGEETTPPPGQPAEPSKIGQMEHNAAEAIHKGVDKAKEYGAKAADKTGQVVEKAGTAIEKAGEKLEKAAVETVKEKAGETAAKVVEGAGKVVEKAGAGLEKGGEKIQDAVKKE
ncbi:hypothetical protein ACYOEI_07340 [Singulisphaera rosea]